MDSFFSNKFSPLQTLIIQAVVKTNQKSVDSILYNILKPFTFPKPEIGELYHVVHKSSEIQF